MTHTQLTQLQTVITVAHKEYEKMLNAHAFFKVHDSVSSEDLVQDTFIKTWMYLVKGGRVDTMKAFLYHILNNLIVDEYRKHKTSSLDALLEKGFQPSAGGFERLNNTLDGRAAVLLIERLPKMYRRVMRMRYIQDLTLKEMSQNTGQSVNAIAVQLHRGLNKLRLLYNFA